MWVIKVNWDAALDLNNKKMGVGIIGRDYLGQVLAVFCDTEPFIQEPVVAEAWAAWRAVELCQKMGWMKI